VAGTELKQNRAAVYVVVTLRDENGHEYEIHGSSFYWDLKRKSSPTATAAGR
jgi:hypothetical protein